jgi:predicted RNase H-like nuclease (RuvC/YqgF family)
MAIDGALIQTVLSGVVSGGGSALTAFAATFRDIKKRLKALEEKVGADGADGNPKTGLYLVVERLDEIARKVKKELDSWEEDPPEWLLRLVNKAARNSSVNMEHSGELERVFEGRFRTSASNLQRLDEKLQNLQGQLEDTIGRAEYERDSRKRSEEMSKELTSLREQLATINGLLRGIMTGMGYIDPPPNLIPKKTR